MYKIKIHFLKLHEISVPDFLRAVGVYVIWDAKAIARPTYIGEGNILKRFTDHLGRNGKPFAHPWDGYVAAILGSTKGVHKEESRAVERLLLDVASEINCRPHENRHSGHASSVLNYCQDEQLRVAISGYDPFLPPRTSRPLARPKLINVRAGNEQPFDIVHGWRNRRTRPPVIKRRFF